MRRKHRGLLVKCPPFHGAGIPYELWPRSVRNDSDFCRSAAFLRITRTNEVLITAAWALFVCFVHQCFSCLRTALPSPGLLLLCTHTRAHTCTHAKHKEFQVIRDSAVYSVKTVLVISLWRGKTLDRRYFLFLLFVT